MDKKTMNHQVFLVIDDVENVLNTINQQLVQIYPECHIIRAKSVQDAKKKFLEHQKEITFIICDWIMPEENGTVFLKFIRFELALKNIPFMMLTSSNEPLSIMEAITCGVSGYMTKPWKKADLEKKIEIISKKFSS